MPETYTELPLLTDRFDRALRLATDHHRAQLRKGTEIPYVSHLLGVTSLVLEMGGSEDEAIAALLHDAVEDGGGEPMLELIRAEYGADVARIVRANSDTIAEPKPPWLQRKQAYVASIAGKQPDELRVSLADKLHNTRAILRDLRTHGNVVWERFATGQRGVRWYYRAMHEALSERRDDLGAAALPLLDELGWTVDEIDRLATDPRSQR
jgi:(p)ppGpp synthase/HD superfamily hydrolase